MNCPERFDTTIMHFRNRRTGSEVHLLGMVHVGDISYYTKTQAELDEREAAGHVVHYEMIQSDGSSSSWKTRRKIDLLRDSSSRLNELAQSIGLVTQRDNIQLRPTWSNHDMSIEEYAAAISSASALKRYTVTRLVTKLMGLLPTEQRAKLMSDVLESLETTVLHKRGDLVIDSEEVRAVLGLGDDKTTLDMRNSLSMLAVDDVLAEDPAQDITLMWGEAHLHGQRELLQERGYVQTDEQRLPAIIYDKLS